MPIRALILVCSAAIVAVVAVGCSDSAKAPQAKKQVGKTSQKTAVAKQPSRSAIDNSQATAPQNADDVQSTNERPDATAAASDIKPEPDATDAKRVTALKPPQIRPAVMPEVVLSAAHAEKCLIRVGDEFPEFRLPNLSGKAQSLGDVQGDALTVVVLWSADRLLAEEQLRFLEQRIGRYADLGVKTIAINMGDAPENVRPVLDATEYSDAVLLDPERRLLMHVGQGHLPRTYLLDRDGRVLWFDIEFSRQTREQLEQAIHASLKST